MVTVGDISGTVTKIQIRATTIRDLDRKELLVPNKEFITGRLLNWSLSDTISRLLLPVGIAYESDVPLAMKLMLEAARENDMIIDEPAPLITFDSFGDNALTLTARVYIDDLDNRVNAISALHSAINEKFGEAGIVIAFPQRDVHLDTSKPLEIRIHKDKQNYDQGPIPVRLRRTVTNRILPSGGKDKPCNASREYMAYHQRYQYLKMVFTELPKATRVEDIEALLPVKPGAELDEAALYH